MLELVSIQKTPIKGIVLVGPSTSKTPCYMQNFNHSLCRNPQETNNVIIARSLWWELWCRPRVPMPVADRRSLSIRGRLVPDDRSTARSGCSCCPVFARYR